MQFDQTSSVTTVLSENENGDLILDFPIELLQLLGWKAGDTLEIGTFAGRVIFRRINSPDSSEGASQESDG